MHTGLGLALMSHGPAQGFAVHRYMRQPLLRWFCQHSARFVATLGHRSGFEHHLGDYGDDLLPITAGQSLTIGRIGREPLGPVQLAAQLGLSFFDPIHHAIDRRFSG